MIPPEPNLRVSVVVPARDEEKLVGRCLRSLASQSGVPPEEYEVLLVLDRCTDRTEDKAREVASEHPELRLRLLGGPGLGAGHARRVGMEEACGRLFSLERPGAIIASTDADTAVAPDWLYRQLSAARHGARAIGGRIELSEDAVVPDGVRSWRDRRGETRRLSLLDRAGDVDSARRIEHWQFSGASLSLTAEAYREVGGMEPRAALEDEYLEHALERCGIPIERPLDVRVATSPRLVGRASRGLAKDLSLASWLQGNTYRESPDAGSLRPHGEPRATASVVIPVRGDETTPEPPVIPGVELETIPVPVAGSGAPLVCGFGPVRGRGDALWRGLSRAEGELVVLLPDGSAGSMGGIPALLAPLMAREELELVKGYPAGDGASQMSRLVGAPLINLHRPELAGFFDPLSGCVAARRGLLASLPFPVGAGVDASLLLDTARSRGPEAVAQAALPEEDTGPGSTEDSYAIMAAFLRRTGGGSGLPSPAPLAIPDPKGPGFDSRRVQVEERPPLETLERPASGSRAVPLGDEEPRG